MEQLEQQARWVEDPDGILQWALALGLRNEKGGALEWEDHRFLIDILCDLHPYQVCIKSAQVGLSTLQILKATFMAQIVGYGVVYTLPTDQLMGVFSATKVEPILKANPYLTPTGASSVGKRVYDQGFTLWSGTFGERQQIMVTADLLVNDESERSNQAVLQGLESRLQYSKYKGQWWFSNPWRPNMATDALWQISDQRKWHVTCRNCGDEQPFDGKAFWTNIDRQRGMYVCRRCGEEITDDDRRAGRWIATNPAATKWHGYTISQLMAPWVSAAEILEAEPGRPGGKTLDYFYNFVLGLPVVGEGVSVDPALLRQAWAPEEELRELDPRQRFMGIDPGGALHVTIGNEYGITKLAVLQDAGRPGEPGYESKWDQAAKLMKWERINLCVVDNAPAEEQVKLQKQFPGRVLRCIYDYNADRQASTEVDYKDGTVNAHRTRIIDETISAFADGGIKVFTDPQDKLFVGTGKPGAVENCLVGHWSTLYVVGADGQDVNIVKRDRMGNVIRTWENAGPDHFAHSTVYYWIARQLRKGAAGAGMLVSPLATGGRPRRRREDDDDEDDDDEGPKRPGFYGR